MSREGTERRASRARRGIVVLASSLLLAIPAAAGWAAIEAAPSPFPRPPARDDRPAASWQVAQTGRSATPGAKAPQRGSSAMLEGGSSADRYGGSSADGDGVAGPQHRPGMSKPRPFGKSGGGGIDKDKQYEKDRRLEDQEDRQERQRKAEEEDRRRPRAR